MKIFILIGNPYIDEIQIPILPTCMTSKIMIKNSNRFRFFFSVKVYVYCHQKQRLELIIPWGVKTSTQKPQKLPVIECFFLGSLILGFENSWQQSPLSDLVEKNYSFHQEKTEY